MKNKLNEFRGITLIALIITIIVLVIIAGISIALLTGENGILNQSIESARATEVAELEEALGLWEYDAEISKYSSEILTKLDEVLNKYEESGLITKENIENLKNGIDIEVYGRIIKAPKKNEDSTSGMQPGDVAGVGGEGYIDTDNKRAFVPEGGVISTELSEDSVNEGLVMILEQNEYVWVDASKVDFSEVESETDYVEIEKSINNYVQEYINTNYLDNIEQYSEIKKEVLKGIYINKGFWVSRYEAGTSRWRERRSDELTPVVSQKDAYPYIFVTREEAQNLIQELKVENKYDMSLLFGFQVNLILKFMEAAGGITKEEITLNSTNIGNFNDSSYEIKDGRYANSHPREFKDGVGATKTEGQTWILTTGTTIETSDGTNKILNIYDIAGNVEEITLEYHYRYLMTYNNSSAGASGKSAPAASRSAVGSATWNSGSLGFRFAIY